MGSIMSKMDDDIDTYEYLCRKYKEKFVAVYSAHHDWLVLKNENKTKVKFSEYQKTKNIKDLETKIEDIKEKILSFKVKLKESKKQLKILKNEK